MLGCQPRALRVPRAHRVAPRPAEADEHGWDAGLLEGVIGRRTLLDEGEHDDPGDALAQQHVHAGNRHVGAALDVAEHRRVAGAERGALDPLRHLRVVGIAEVVQQDAQHRGALLDELPGDAVGPVAEAARSPPAPVSASRGEISATPRTTLDTVDLETPASAATSKMVGGLRGSGTAVRSAISTDLIMQTIIAAGSAADSAST